MSEKGDLSNSASGNSMDRDSLPQIMLTCPACPRHCRLRPGEKGACNGRKNTGSRIEPVNYGRITSAALDPIEKKPLKCFKSGSRIFSVGSFGCNLFCPFCQNHSISRAEGGSVESDLIYPDELLSLALDLKNDGNIGVAFTYNEPLVSWEYVRDCAGLLKKNGLTTVLVTNGCFEEEVLNEILPFTDAMNIDLKCFTGSGYRDLGGDLETVKRFIKGASKHCHIELTSLIVPGLNDSTAKMTEQCDWIADTDPGIPLHITRYFPCYKMTSPPPTDVALMHRLKELAQKKLTHVFLGNI